MTSRMAFWDAHGTIATFGKTSLDQTLMGLEGHGCSNQSHGSVCHFKVFGHRIAMISSIITIKKHE